MTSPLWASEPPLDKPLWVTPLLPSPDDAAAVERMARAMWLEDNYSIDREPKPVVPANPTPYVGMARAALRALWEARP